MKACIIIGAQSLNLTDVAFLPTQMLRLGGVSWSLGMPILGCLIRRAHHSVVVLEQWGGGLWHNWGSGLKPLRRRILAYVHVEAGELVLVFGHANCGIIHLEGTLLSCSARAVSGGLWHN